MKPLLSFLLIVSLVLLVSCSNEPAVVVEKASQSQKLSDDNVFKGYETVLDKANGVEQTIQDAAKQRAGEINRQGG